MTKVLDGYLVRGVVSVILWILDFTKIKCHFIKIFFEIILIKFDFILIKWHFISLTLNWGVIEVKKSIFRKTIFSLN